MRIRTVHLSVVALALSGIATGQSVPRQFVVAGKPAEKLHDFNTINLETARRIAETCEALVVAREPKPTYEKDKDGNTIYPVQINGEAPQQTVIIIDKEGNHVYYDRMDGQNYTNVVTAEMKARTAMLTREPSKATMNRVQRDPNDEAWEVQIDLYPVAGGLPIIVNNQTIGYVGAGGYRPNPPVWSDEICVHKAMEQVLGPSVPPLIEDIHEERGGRGGGPNALPVPMWGSTKAPKSSLPAEWVVSGAGSAHVMEGTQISLAAAKSVAKGCREFAASKGQTATIYIVNDAFEMVHMERMDGEFPGNARTALLKARTAQRLREPTSLRGAPLKNSGRTSPRDFAPNEFNFYLGIGGIPIVIDGQMVGSVGVSTSDNSQDEACAMAGLKSTFGDRALLPIYKTAPAAAGH
jgi:uncharacterized protein GlcG (DUF336 family)